VKKILLIVVTAGMALSLAVAVAYGQDAPIRVGGNVQQANRLSWVTPVYPPEAKENRIEGTVSLQVTIGKDGHVSDVSLISGPDELVSSAVEAVQQWVYKPTLLNGEPVRVITSVDVNYTLAR
jgi:protein TonB